MKASMSRALQSFDLKQIWKKKTRWCKRRFKVFKARHCLSPLVVPVTNHYILMFLIPPVEWNQRQ